MKLKPFTDRAICPKCQTGWASRRTKPKYCRNLTCKSFAAQPILDSVPEHLHCTCGECGYKWLMECADAVEQPKEDELNPAPTVIDVCCPGCHASISYWLHDGEPSLKQWSVLTEQQP